MESSPVIWTAEPIARTLCERLAAVRGRPCGNVVASAQEFLKARRDPQTVAFVDAAGLAAIAKEVKQVTSLGPIVAICDGPLQTAIGWLPAHPWLSHVVSTAMLQHPMVVEHLANVMSTLTSTEPRLLDWLGPEVAGRRVLLTRASRRTERLEKMSEFFDSKGVGSRTVQLLRDVTEELLTNAFYDAPVAAGVVKKAISRTNDVVLPDDDACDLVYGCRDDLALVRVRDPFGGLTRARLVEVLTRCARTDMKVEVDETMGGAGLGLWRIVSVASFVAISVVSQRHTEFLVGIAKRAAPGPRPFALHMFFKVGKRRLWRLFDGDASEPPVEQSVAILKD